MFESLLKAAIGAVVETPVSLAADVITLGGTLTDRETTYTSEAISKIVKNISETTD